MDIAVLGLGHVGATMAACLVRDGHRVLGIDVHPEKIAAVAAGRAPIVEPQVGDWLAAGVAERRLRAARSLDDARDGLDIVFVCVGTPARADGAIDLSHVLGCTDEIGRAARARAAAQPLLVVYRSTMAPGSMERQVLPRLQRAAGAPRGSR